MRRAIWDNNFRQMRHFEIVPVDVNWQPNCINGLHQFDEAYFKCACGKFTYKN